MKKLLSLLCVLSLSAALLAGCSTAGDAGTSETPGSSSTPSEVTEPGSSQETVDSLDVNVMALKGPTAMGMVKMMADSEPVEEFTDQLKEEYENVVSSGNIYHFTITSATDEVSAALAQGTTDIAAVPANLASVLYNNTEGGVQVLAINTLGRALHRGERGTRYTPWRISGARPFTPAARETRRRPPSIMC